MTQIILGWKQVGNRLIYIVKMRVFPSTFFEFVLISYKTLRSSENW